MPVCKHCHKQISRFDHDVCPYCGEENPIAEGYETQDVTQFLDQMGEHELYKSKSRLTAGLLCIFLGYFGIHDFYLKKYRLAALELTATILLVGGIGTILFLLVLPNILAFLIPFGVIWLVYVILGIRLLRLQSPRDGEGVLLR